MDELDKERSAALKEVRELLSKGWTSGCYAIDKYGHACNPHNPNAVGFCLLGALLKLGYKDLLAPFLDYKLELTLSTFNDCVGKEGVLQKLDSLIDELEESIR